MIALRLFAPTQCKIIIKYLSAGLISRPSVGINVGIQDKKPTIPFDLKGNIMSACLFQKLSKAKRSAISPLPSFQPQAKVHLPRR
jgi:hypothetical protein